MARLGVLTAVFLSVEAGAGAALRSAMDLSVPVSVPRVAAAAILDKPGCCRVDSS